MIWNVAWYWQVLIGVFGTTLFVIMATVLVLLGEIWAMKHLERKSKERWRTEYGDPSKYYMFGDYGEGDLYFYIPGVINEIEYMYTHTEEEEEKDDEHT